MLVSVVLNSLESQGVESMNQPLPLASSSMLIVAALGRPFWSYPVMVASASCPVGRLVMLKVKPRSVGRCQSVTRVDWSRVK